MGRVTLIVSHESQLVAVDARGGRGDPIRIKPPAPLREKQKKSKKKNKKKKKKKNLAERGRYKRGPVSSGTKRLSVPVGPNILVGPG